MLSAHCFDGEPEPETGSDWQSQHSATECKDCHPLTLFQFPAPGPPPGLGELAWLAWSLGVAAGLGGRLANSGCVTTEPRNCVSCGLVVRNREANTSVRGHAPRPLLGIRPGLVLGVPLSPGSRLRASMCRGSGRLECTMYKVSAFSPGMPGDNSALEP